MAIKNPLTAALEQAYKCEGIELKRITGFQESDN
jgi:hypothetical protein